MSRPALHSPTLLALVRAAAARFDPPVGIAGLGKTEALRRVAERGGLECVFGAGRAASKLGWHPVVRALVAQPDPALILRRWLRLERFGHASNRTNLRAATASDGLHRLQLEHISTDGRPIADVDDHFIWGVLVGLLEAGGVVVQEAALDAGGRRSLLYRVDASEQRPPPHGPAAPSHLLWLVCTPGRTPPGAAPAAPGSLVTRLRSCFEADLLHPWTLAEAARHCAMSSRNLQRMLRANGQSFSRLLQRARLDAARARLSDSRLSLAEIAFCSGFSDQAHFSRLFRRHFDVPPSELRRLLGPES